MSRSSSKSPGVRAQGSPIHFAQSEPAPNQDNKPPEVKTQDSQPVSVADVADPKSLELEISAETSNPEVQGAKSVSSVEEKKGDNEGLRIGPSYAPSKSPVAQGEARKKEGPERHILKTIKTARIEPQ